MKAALYARFSTEKQRDASVEDQFRECERVAKAAGLEVVVRFSDAAISGGTATRRGYQAMLAAARNREFDIIVAEDISRLWRNRAEFGPRSAELEDLGVHCLTCVGDDTRRDGWGLVIQIKQAVAEHARREASYRTRRGIEGKALAGEATGGRAYGYVAARDSASGKIEVDDGHAQVVRRIFELYANGTSPRGIAAQLNAEGVPSPGATWKRTKRRKDGKWLASAIHGDVRRGLGILNNRRYIGVVAWGRSEWKRLAADSAKRRYRRLDKGAIERTDERLRIVSDELWQRVKARQAQRSAEAGARVQAGVRRRAPGGGRKIYVLSGMLRCRPCGSSYALSNKTRYQCSSHHEGGDGACSVSLSVPRDRAERIILDFTSAELPKFLCEIEARYESRRVVAVDHKARIAELDQKIANFVKAIGEGLRDPELDAALKAARAELEQLKAVAPMRSERKAESIEHRVARMRKRLAEGGEIARETLRELFPKGIWLEPDPFGGRFLWAMARTAMPADGPHLYNDDGSARPEAFSVLYRSRCDQEVGLGGSGGRI